MRSISRVADRVDDRSGAKKEERLEGGMIQHMQECTGQSQQDKNR